MKKSIISIVLLVLCSVALFYFWQNNTKKINSNIKTSNNLENTEKDLILQNLKNSKLSFTIPKNNSKEVPPKTSITFLWDKQIFPLQRSDIWQKKLEEKIIMNPEIKGHWSVLGTSGVLFEPQEEYPPSTEIKITIPAELVGKETKLNFQTPRLKIDSFHTNNLINKQPIEINFNQEINLTTIANKIHLEPNIKFNLEYGKTIRKKAIKPSINKSILKLIPTENWQTDKDYIFTLDKETAGAFGNLKTEKEIKKNFHTIKEFTLKIIPPKYSRGSISLNFSHEINSEILAKYLKISPEIPKEKWEEYIKKWTKEPYKSSYFYLNPFDEIWTPNQKYIIEINSQLTDIYQRKLKDNYKINFTTIFQDQINSLYFPEYNTVFSSKSNPKFVFRYTGKKRLIRIELSKKIPNQITETYNLDLLDSTDKESVFEIDLIKNFPKLFPEGKIKYGEYEIKIFEKNKEWARWSSAFFVSDFAVGIKKFANEFVTISTQSFDGFILDQEIEKIEGYSYEGHLSRTIKNNELNEILTNGYKFDYEIIVVKLKNGKVGIGSTEFNKKMSRYDTNINFDSWAYKNNITGVTLTDRPLFRPGDKVYFKSIFRNKENFGKNFPLKDVNPNKKQTYNISIMNPFWEEVFTTNKATLGGELDGFWIIPENSPLGEYQLNIKIKNQNFSTTFHVQKFRKPKFLINANFSEKLAILKEKIKAKISAQYAFGGNLTDKEIKYTISLFGYEKNCDWWCDKQDKLLTSGEGILDKNGEFQIPINLDFDTQEDENILWNTLTLNTTIVASKDEKSSFEVSIPFFHSKRIINLENSKYFYPPKIKITQTGKLTNLKKEPVKNELTAKLYLEKWIRNDRKNVDGDFYGEWMRDDVLIKEETINSNKDGKFAWSFQTPEKAGNYFTRFTAKDEKNRKIIAEKYFWISGNNFASLRKNDQNRILKVFTDKDQYEIGDEVEIFFPLSDFEINPKTSRATIERGEVLEVLPIDFKNNIIKFKTEEWMTPNIYVSLLLSGKDKDGNQDVRWGSVKVPIIDESRKLEISITPSKEKYKPGEEIELKIKTKIQDSPTSASVTISVVDETLLALISRPKLDLWEKFLADIPLGVATSHTLANFTSNKELQEILDKVAKIKSRLSFGHGGGGGGSKGNEFKPRGDFRDTATFIAKIKTDKNGEAIAKFKAPDNLTTWNIWAIGHTYNNAFGETESSTQVTLPMIISEIVPNGFVSGDKAKIGILIRRNNEKQKTTKIKVKLNIPKNIIADITEKEIEVEKEARVFFPIKIKQLKNLNNEFEKIKLGFEIKSDDGLTDSIIIERKIFPPKISLSVADFLRINETKNIKIIPDLINAISSKLSIKLSPSLVTKLENLIDITQKMNYGCAEQRLSKSTAILLQKNLDETLNRKSTEINKSELIENRNYIEESFINNGFGFWNNSDNPNVWVTVNVLENKWLWKKYGAPFNQEKIEKAKQYIFQEIKKTCKEYQWYCLNDTTRNYAASILASNDILNTNDLDFLMKYTESFEAKIWWIKTARILEEKGLRLSPLSKRFKKTAWTEIQNNMKVRDRYIFWEEDSRAFYSQNERLTAIILEELLKTNKFQEYQHKIARYLIESKSQNLSGNTAMRILRTLKFYTEKYEIKNFDAEFLIQNNKKEIAKDKFNALEQTLSYDIKPNNENLEIKITPVNKKEFYADISLQEVFPTDKITPISKGFFIERNIYELEDKEFKNPLTSLELGKNYVVRLQIVTNTSHRQISLIDYAPAGAEFINLEFSNTDKTLSSYVDDDECYGWCRPKFDHQEFHETKVKFFTDYLPAGTHEIKYLIQTRIAGEFQVLPAQIEEMYFPEVFATTNGKIVEIK